MVFSTRVASVIPRDLSSQPVRKLFSSAQSGTPLPLPEPPSPFLLIRSRNLVILLELAQGVLDTHNLCESWVCPLLPTKYGLGCVSGPGGHVGDYCANGAGGLGRHLLKEPAAEHGEVALGTAQ